MSAQEAEGSDASRDDAVGSPCEFAIVGVGASAGGLAALTELLNEVSFEFMAFVVVQHLDPQHESHLTQLLSRTAKVEVVVAEHGMTVKPDHVYVNPPNSDLTICGGKLVLASPADDKTPRRPIDHFFRSLAEDLGSAALAVVLSGTGNDGTIGLEAIKSAGGLAFVQDPASAKFDGMPKNALASGCVDFSLSPKAIAEALARLSRERRGGRGPPSPHEVRERESAMATLFGLIRSECGTDLQHYKPATLERRIARRIALLGLNGLAEYVQFVASHREELRGLYDDVLIAVTSFFRDPELFTALASEVYPRLLAERAPGAALRIWVAACSTGEEAYSLAISLLELQEPLAEKVPVQIFATDLDEESIQIARRGVYARGIEADVSRERLGRYFVETEGGYQVCRRLRDMIIFSKHNILKDPPFARLDLATCRNLLIYLKPSAQRHVLRILHYGLRAEGVLALGTSETVGDAPDLFSLVDRKQKIYSKKQIGGLAVIEMGLEGRGPPATFTPKLDVRSATSFQNVAERKAIELYAPPGVVVDENMEVLHFRGHVGPYLNPTSGTPSFNILRLARPELHLELRRGIEKAFASKTRVSSEVQFCEEGEMHLVLLDFLPIEEPTTSSRCLLVFFVRQPRPKRIPVVVSGDAGSDDVSSPLVQRIQELERDLGVTKEYLQTTIAEQEDANEQLKAANEELQSSNEELQSMNEELETSKEELQSTNEELTTVNDELQNRMSELSVTNDDLHNVLAGVEAAVLIVGLDLRIRRYTPAAERLFNLVPGDLGRPIQFFNTYCGGVEVEKLVATVIGTLATVQEEVLFTNQRWYSLRITPYRTLEHSIRGAVISLSDVDVRKRSADLARDVGEYAAKFLGGITQPLLILDGRLRVAWTNDAFLETFQVAAAEALGHLLANLGGRQWAHPQLDEHLASAIDGKAFRDLEFQYRFHDARSRAFNVSGTRIPLLSGAVMLLLSIEAAEGGGT